MLNNVLVRKEPRQKSARILRSVIFSKGKRRETLRLTEKGQDGRQDSGRRFIKPLRDGDIGPDLI